MQMAALARVFPHIRSVIQRILAESHIALAAVEAGLVNTMRHGTMPEKTHTHVETAETEARTAEAVKMEIDKESGCQPLNTQAAGKAERMAEEMARIGTFRILTVQMPQLMAAAVAAL